MLNRLTRFAQDHKKSLLESTPFIGWNHFDVVTRLPRDRFIQYALQNSNSEEFRNLLAPEIATAAYYTMLYLADKKNRNLHEANSQHTENKDIVLEIKSISTPNSAWDLLEQRVVPNMLPIKMASRNNLIAVANDVVKNYAKAFDRPEVKEFKELYNTFSQLRTYFLQGKKTLFDACSTEPVYREYVQYYYGQEGWFTCYHPKVPEPFPAEEQNKNTSMIDIAARFLQTQIIILLENGEYSTEFAIKQGWFRNQTSVTYEILSPEYKFYCTKKLSKYARPIRKIGYDGVHFVKLEKALETQRSDHHHIYLSGILPNGVELTFTEEQVDGSEGNCAFNALQTTRTQVVRCLMALMDRVEMREKLAPEIQQALTLNVAGRSEWQPASSKLRLEWRALVQARIEEEIKMDNLKRTLRDDFPQWIPEANTNQDTQLISLKNYISARDPQTRHTMQAVDNIKEQERASFNAHKKIIDYCARLEIAQEYVKGFTDREKRGKHLWLGYYSAALYAEHNLISLYIWRKKSSSHQKLELAFYPSNASHPKVVHMLHTGSYNHFNLLKERNELKEDHLNEMSQQHGSVSLNFFRINPVNITDPLYPKLTWSTKGYALVYIWKACKKNNVKFGHVSMQLFAEDNELIEWEDGGYISVYPANLLEDREKKIVYHQSIDEDRNDEGPICDLTFKVINIHIDAIASAFKKMRASGKLKWSLDASGCFKNRNTVNCCGLVLDLLINYGGLSADNIKRQGLFSCPFEHIFDSDQHEPYYRAKNIMCAVSNKHDFFEGIFNFLKELAAMIILYAMIKGIISSDIEANYIPLRILDGILLFWLIFARISPILSRCVSTLFAHTAFSPQDAYFLLLFLSNRSNLSKPIKVSLIDKYTAAAECKYRSDEPDEPDEPTNVCLCCFSIICKCIRASYSIYRFFKREEEHKMLINAENASPESVRRQYNTL